MEERVLAGNAALARGAWAEARAIFEQELEVHESLASAPLRANRVSSRTRLLEHKTCPRRRLSWRLPSGNLAKELLQAAGRANETDARYSVALILERVPHPAGEEMGVARGEHAPFTVVYDKFA